MVRPRRKKPPETEATNPAHAFVLFSRHRALWSATLGALAKRMYVAPLPLRTATSTDYLIYVIVHLEPK